MSIPKTYKYALGAHYVCIAGLIGGLAMAVLPAMLVLVYCSTFVLPQLRNTKGEKLNRLGQVLERLGAAAQRAFSE